MSTGEFDYGDVLQGDNDAPVCTQAVASSRRTEGAC